MEKEIITIRKARVADVDEMVKLYRYTWLEVYSDFVRPDQYPTLAPNARKEKFLTKIAEKDSSFLVAEINGAIIGMVGAQPNKYYTDKSYKMCITYLYLYERYSGQGISTVLFKTMLYRLKRLGEEKIMLWCIKDNLRAIHFYKKHQGNLITNVKIPKDFLGTDCVVFTWNLGNLNEENDIFNHLTRKN